MVVYCVWCPNTSETQWVRTSPDSPSRGICLDCEKEAEDTR